MKNKTITTEKADKCIANVIVETNEDFTGL